MEPIATYRGTWLEGSYRFDLFPDSLRAVGSVFLRSDEDATIALAGLQVRVDRLRVRSGLFDGGLWITLVTLIVCPVTVAALKLDPIGPWAGLLASPVLGGLGLIFAAAKKQEFARFVTDGGLAAVVIPRTQAADGFDEFINRVLEQIRHCKGLPEVDVSGDSPHA